MRATCRVRSRSTSAAGAVQVRTRPTDRRTRSDSVNPAERAFACHSARSASLARIFTHTSCPAPLMCRCRWEGQRGGAPRQPLPGTREAWPQGVGWLSHLRVAQASPADAPATPVRAPPGTTPAEPSRASSSASRSSASRTGRATGDPSTPWRWPRPLPRRRFPPYPYPSGTGDRRSSAILRPVG